MRRFVLVQEILRRLPVSNHFLHQYWPLTRQRYSKNVWSKILPCHVLTWDWNCHLNIFAKFGSDWVIQVYLLYSFDNLKVVQTSPIAKFWAHNLLQCILNYKGVMQKIMYDVYWKKTRIHCPNWLDCVLPFCSFISCPSFNFCCNVYFFILTRNTSSFLLWCDEEDLGSTSSSILNLFNKYISIANQRGLQCEYKDTMIILGMVGSFIRPTSHVVMVSKFLAIYSKWVIFKNKGHTGVIFLWNQAFEWKLQRLILASHGRLSLRASQRGTAHWHQRVPTEIELSLCATIVFDDQRNTITSHVFWCSVAEFQFLLITKKTLLQMLSDVSSYVDDRKKKHYFTRCL